MSSWTTCVRGARSRPASVAGWVLMLVICETGCRSTSINGMATAGSGSGGASATIASSSASTGGSSLGSSSAGANGTGTVGATSSGSSSGTTGSGACGPNTIWLGDECVTQDCKSFGTLPCLLTDGGFGQCEFGTCLPPFTDSQNCGGYRFACPAGSVCWDYSCFFPDSGPIGCPPPFAYQFESGLCALTSCAGAQDNEACGAGDGLFCCNGTCIRPDPQNCGGCGVVCDGDSVCIGSKCEPPIDCSFANLGYGCRLSDGTVGSCCGGSCVDLSSDPMNCGGCGEVVAVGGSCQLGQTSGSCEDAGCPPGTLCAERPGLACLSTACSFDVEGNACLASDGGEWGVCCGGTCDLVDEASCGICYSCPDGQVCAEGACAPAGDCAISMSSSCVTDAGAPGACCGSTCVDVRVDSSNCGICGEGCPIGQQCFTAGQCTAKCGSDDPCPAGDLCSDGVCIQMGCNGTNADCFVNGDAGMCCGGQCVPATEGGRCGACGSTCPPGGTCKETGGCSTAEGDAVCGRVGSTVAGIGPCPPGSLCSNNEECDPILDCKLADQTPGGYYGCVFGATELGTCCGESCVLLEDSPFNCGGCGIACPSGVCVQGRCLPQSPSADCGGRCGPNSVCVDGTCVGKACGFDPVFDFCLARNGSVGYCCISGICAHFLDDPQNCGVCGNACAEGETCSDGTCSGSPECGPRQMFGFCNLDAGTSWTCCPGAGCTDLLTDPNNCGDCGLLCPPPFTCRAGTCG